MTFWDIIKMLFFYKSHLGFYLGDVILEKKFLLNKMLNKMRILAKKSDGQSCLIDYQKELNEEQWRVVSTGDGPSLVLAGAGSGKTRTLVYRVAYLLEKGIPARNILLLTFTNKAAGEMMRRVESLLGHKPTGLVGGTFHSVANRILRRYGELLGYSNNFTILDSDDSKSFLKAVIVDLDLPIRRERYFPKVDVIHSLISFAQNSGQDIKSAIEKKYSRWPAVLVSALDDIFEKYSEKKKLANTMDFDDLLVNWHRLLQFNERVADFLSDQFHYILVDEYQDTNKIQGLILDRLAKKHQNILAVGDDSQSIYSFRAATVANILSFPQKYTSSKIFKLETNYRSSIEILALANESIKNNKEQFAKNLKSIRSENGRLPVVATLSDAYQQAEFVSKKILELAEGGIDLKKMAVLFRSSYQLIELELEMNKKRIPYQVRGGLRFFEQAHIKDVIAYLKVIANFKDEISWARLLSLYPGIGLTSAKKIFTKIQQFDSLENLLKNYQSFSFPPRIKNSLNIVFLLFQRLSLFIPTEVEKKKIDLAKMITEILTSGYKEIIRTKFENFSERIEDLEQLAIFSQSYQDITQFLSDVSLSEGFRGEKNKARQEEIDDDYLVLSTIHQAKGLEWSFVFVIGLAEGQFPHYKVYENGEELAEERRLFYVATTRAKEELYLSYPVFSHGFSSSSNINRPSTFLAELPEELYEVWQEESSGVNSKIDIFSNVKTDFFDDDDKVIEYD